MRAGMQVMLQNLERGVGADRAVVAEDLALAELGVELGYESLWGTEHHFTGYSMIPNVLLLLSYFAGRYPDVDIGTSVIVLPWHHPMRVAGEVALLDNLCGGRLTLGIGRGLGRSEFEGFGIPMDSSRARLVEGAEILLAGLDEASVSYDGEQFSVPERAVRPRPTSPFRKRSYAAAVSPESSEIMGRLGVGVLLGAQKTWDDATKDYAVYEQVYTDQWGEAPPAPIFNPKVFVDRDRDRAHELGRKYMRKYFAAVLDHYEMLGDHFATTKGYEFYAEDTSTPVDQILDGYVDMQVLGTPEECIEQLDEAHRHVGVGEVIGLYSYGDMPYEIAAGNLRTFAEDVTPKLASIGSSGA